ncbi:MAG: transposase family protein [Bacteroidota bacterium]
MWNSQKTFFHDGEKLWVTISGLTNFGLTSSYIRKAIHQQRINHSSGWQHIQNPPFPGIKVLIDWDSIPTQTVNDKGLPTKASVVSEMKQKASENNEALTGKIDFADSRGFDKYLIYYPEATLETRRQLAKACAVLQIGVEWKKGDFDIHSKADFYKSFGREVKRIGLKYLKTSTPDRLGRKVRKAIKEGVTTVIKQPNKGNDHRQKMSAWHQYVITAYYAHPQKFTAPMISALLLYQCTLHDKPLVSESTIRHFVAKREIQNICIASRHGQKAFADFFRPYINRKGVLFSSDLWVLDGTKAAFAFREGGKIKFLDLFIVMDAHSWNILGFAMADNEDRWTLIEAMKMAVSITGHLPAQILLDNFSSKHTEEVQDLFAQVEEFGTNVRYAKVGNAKDKHVERGFQAYHNLAARWWPNFVGEGIKSRRSNARPSPEYIAQQSKNLPDRNGVMIQILDSINLYCETVSEGGKKELGTPRQRFQKSEKPSVYGVTTEDVANLFWASRLEKMRNSFIRIQIRGVKYVYACLEYEVWKKYDCNTSERDIKVKVRYDEKDLSEIMIFDAKTNEFLCICQQDVQVVGESANQTDKDIKLLMGKESRIKSWERRLEKELETMRDEAIKQQSGDVELVLITDVATVKKEEINTAQSQVYARYFSDQQSMPLKRHDPKEDNYNPGKRKKKTKGVYQNDPTFEEINY